MKGFKGTKEKWSTTDKGVRSDSGYICFIPDVNKYGGQDERFAQEVAEKEANARLIASSPDLLEALQEMDKDLCVLEGTMTAIEESNHLADGMTDLIKKWRERGKKAINKALGL